jgi:hypothetical protein
MSSELNNSTSSSTASDWANANTNVYSSPLTTTSTTSLNSNAWGSLTFGTPTIVYRPTPLPIHNPKVKLLVEQVWSPDGEVETGGVLLEIIGDGNLIQIRFESADAMRQAMALINTFLDNEGTALDLRKAVS